MIYSCQVELQTFTIIYHQPAWGTLFVCMGCNVANSGLEDFKSQSLSCLIITHHVEDCCNFTSLRVLLKFCWCTEVSASLHTFQPWQLTGQANVVLGGPHVLCSWLSVTVCGGLRKPMITSIEAAHDSLLVNWISMPLFSQGWNPHPDHPQPAS